MSKPENPSSVPAPLEEELKFIDGLSAADRSRWLKVLIGNFVTRKTALETTRRRRMGLKTELKINENAMDFLWFFLLFIL